MELNLTKPIVFFDLETTGVQVGRDRIVQICMLKIHPDGIEEERTYMVRPVESDGTTMHIPEESTQIHHFTDADVAGERTFAELAPEIASFVGNADLAGYNSNRFDVPMLVEEFLRAGVDFDLEGRRLVDVQNIFHKMEQRTLVAAYQFYCGKDLSNAHSADGDTRATYEVLKAQLDRYKGVDYSDQRGVVHSPVVNDIESLSRFTRSAEWADLVGHFGINKDGYEVFNFGKHKGKTIESVFRAEPAYYDWIMKSDFPLTTKQVATKVYQRIVEKRKREEQAKLQALKLKFEGEL